MTAEQTLAVIDNKLKELGMSRRKLALQAGIPPSTLQTAFDKKRELSIENLIRISDTLDIPLYNLTDWVITRQKNGYQVRAPEKACRELIEDVYWQKHQQEIENQDANISVPKKNKDDLIGDNIVKFINLSPEKQGIMFNIFKSFASVIQNNDLNNEVESDFIKALKDLLLLPYDIQEAISPVLDKLLKCEWIPSPDDSDE